MKKKPPSQDYLDHLVIQASVEDSVLVGGMAVNLWAKAYGIESRISHLTGDIDFFGDHLAIEESAEKLRAAGENVTEYLATLDDATPNSGRLTVAAKAQDVEPAGIDFMARIDGLSTDDIVAKAVPLQLGDATVFVMHPILLLENKISNLALYPNKRNAAGVEQARLAIEIARHFLENHARNEERRATLLLVERIARAAGREAACFAAKAFQLVMLDALPDEATLRKVDAALVDLRLPQLRAHVTERQARFDQLWDRMEAISDPRRQRFRS